MLLTKECSWTAVGVPATDMCHREVCQINVRFEVGGNQENCGSHISPVHRASFLFVGFGRLGGNLNSLMP